MKKKIGNKSELLTIAKIKSNEVIKGEENNG